MRHLLPLPLLALACCTSSEGSSARPGTTETIEVRAPAPPPSPDTGPVPTLVVHEWGTFTAVAGTDGVALDWRPLVGHSDLPKFVYDVTRPGLRELGLSSKGDLQGRVRMETPVLYFYAAHEIDVRVAVGFPEGQITEWYPQAKMVHSGGIDWGTIRVLPGADVELPHDGSASHYYPARLADADVVRSCDRDGEEHESFLFYRGVGKAALDLGVTLHGRKLGMHDGGVAPIGEVIVFENEGGALGIEAHAMQRRTNASRPALDDDLESAVALLESRLIASGLRSAEAHAMIETWRGDWFEPGLRVLYLLPRAQTDAMLPLTLDPVPSELVRTMVGRVEVVTPELEADIAAFFARIDRPGHERDTIARLMAHSRFAEPVLARIQGGTASDDLRRRIAAVLAVAGAVAP